MAKTVCYKCNTEIEVEEATIVHPLCQPCEEAHDKWFAEQIAKLDGV